MDLRENFERVYKIKSIQPSWKFLVSFIDWNESLLQVKAKTNTSNRELPFIEPFHIRGITVPFYRFRSETVDYNNLVKTFPIFDSRGGLDLRIEFEEDNAGRVARLIRALQRKIMNTYGLYNAPNQSKIGVIMLDILSQGNEIVSRYKFHNCYFLEAEDMPFSYESGESVKTTITFAIDYYTVEPFPNYNR